MTTDEVFELLANQRVDAEQDVASELDVLDCVRLEDGTLIARYRDGHYERLPQETSLRLEHLGGGDAGSILTDLALPKDFPRDVAATLQETWKRLGLSPVASLTDLALGLAKLKRSERTHALCLAYGELLRTSIDGAWLGIAYASGVEPALVTPRLGIVHFAGYLSRFSNGRALPPFEMFTT